MPKNPFGKRMRLPEGAALIATLVAYISLVAYTIPRHEPWADEAQAWQIAGNTSFLELFRTAIHYEFSPGLWHALLWVLERLHAGYGGLAWFSGGIALCGVGLVLFASPFPPALRMVLPFTYFFAFQYAVVARSYVLFAPLLFLLAVLWNRREQYPVGTAIVIGLLANVSSHALVTAISLFTVIAIEERRRRRESTITTRDYAIAITVATALIAFAVWCLIPPIDSDLWQGLAAMVHVPASTTVGAMNTGGHSLSRVPLFWKLPLLLLTRFTYTLSFGVSQPRALAWIAWMLLLWRWWRERRLRYAVPMVVLGGFCAATRFDMHQAGLVWILLLFLWWVTWPEHNEDFSHRCLIAGVSFFLLCQVWWTVQTLRFEWTQAYSPNRAAAPMLRRYLDEGKLVDVAVPPPEPHAYGEYYAVGLEPYFTTEPFHNEEARYWIWRPHPSMYTQYVRDTEARSVVVLVEDVDNDRRVRAEEQRLAGLGYRKDAFTCARVFYPRQEYPILCHVFYVPK